MLAVLFSPTDMAQAQHYVSLYMQLGRANVDPRRSRTTGARSRFEKYALGRVQQVLGNDALAIRSFEAAYEIFERGRLSLPLRAGRDGDVRDDARRRLARARSRSRRGFPAQRCSARLLHTRAMASENARLLELTPMQRQIAFALCEGLDLAELSRRFSRSAFTLGKHVEAVYQRLGVKNRKALRTAVQAWNVV